LLFRLSEKLTFVQREFGIVDERVRGIVILGRDVLSLKSAVKKVSIRSNEMKSGTLTFFFLTFDFSSSSSSESLESATFFTAAAGGGVGGR